MGEKRGRKIIFQFHKKYWFDVSKALKPMLINGEPFQFSEKKKSENFSSKDSPNQSWYHVRSFFARQVSIVVMKNQTLLYREESE